MKLNLGSGRKGKEGYVNVDMLKIGDVDIVHDLNKIPYPFKDDSADEIMAKAVCEHLNDMEAFMNECHRILKKEGKLIVTVPHYNSAVAYEIDHKIFFKKGWYKIFTEKDFGSLQAATKKRWVFLSQSYKLTKAGKFLRCTTGMKGVLLLSRYIGELIFTFTTVLKPYKEER